MDFNNLFVVGAVVLGLALTLVAIVTFISRNYIKVPPNKVAVFYGRKYKTKDGQEVGFRVVTGGAKFKIPILESVQYLDLSVFSLDLEVKKAPNKDGVEVNLKGVANVKILSDEAALMAACERFLGKTPNEIENIAFKNLEGHLRAIAGKMSIEELVGDRTKLNQAVLEDATVDLKKLGLGVDLLTIQEVTDEKGYIDQLGKKRTAEVVRDAEIGKAEADKQSTIQTTTAAKEAAPTQNENLVKIAESEKIRDVQKATFTAEVAKEQATAAQAGPLATAKAQKDVVIAEQETQKIKIEKETEVAEAVVAKTEKELESEVVKPAEAEKKAQIIKADQEKQVSITQAEGNQQKMQILAEGEKNKVVLEAEGEAQAIIKKATAEADAIKLKANAEATGIEAKGKAEGESIKAKLVAEADGLKAKLLAEAEGVEKKAEAYAKLDKTGQLLQILEVVERVAPQLVKEFAGVMAAAASPFANVDNISIVDFGGNGDATGRFAETVPGMVASFVTKLKAMGFDPTKLLDKVGIEAGDLLNQKSESASNDDKK